MPENILIDLNVIIDVLLERRGFESSRDVLELSELGSHRLYISAHMVTTFAYILEEAKVPHPDIRRHIEWLLRMFVVVPVDEVLLKAALKSRISDYEDAVVEQAAVICNASTIVTRNIKDFKASTAQVLTPEAYVQKT
jgi:predicted nucleic acid-binding protein